jgi:hypothetical protein
MPRSSELTSDNTRHSTGRCDDHQRRLVAFDSAPQFTRNSAGVFGVVQLDVIDEKTLGTNRFGEKPRGGEHEGDLLFVMLDIGCRAPQTTLSLMTCA